MSATSPGIPVRSRPDRCPGVLRPWPAADGGLVRIRVPGGRTASAALRALAEVADQYGDGRVRLTGRANLQVRGLPLDGDRLPEEVVVALEATGLVPSLAHDLARNVMTSPLTGLVGGRADLRPVTAALDRAVLASSRLAGLPGRFLLTLDDGRGDLHDRHRDLGLVALDERTAQLRVGASWGQVVDLAAAPTALVGLALRFLDHRGAGPTAAWHVDELDGPLDEPRPAVLGADVASAALPYGPVAGLPGAEHVAVDDGGISPDLAADWAARTTEVVITPWHGVLL